MTKEEAQELVMNEIKKKISFSKFMWNMTNNIQENTRLMKEILDAHPECGYKIIINENECFQLIKLQ